MERTRSKGRTRATDRARKDEEEKQNENENIEQFKNNNAKPRKLLDSTIKSRNKPQDVRRRTQD